MKLFSPLVNFLTVNRKKNHIGKEMDKGWKKLSMPDVKKIRKDINIFFYSKQN